MPGFYVSNLKNTISLDNVYNDRCIKETIPDDTFTIRRNTLNKFIEDKPFIKKNGLIIVLEGVVLNKSKLLKKYNCGDFVELCSALYIRQGISFVREFRGPFSGCVCDLGKKKWYFFSSHIGDQFFFYYLSKNSFAVGSNVDYVIDSCRQNNIRTTVNKSSIYQMLTFGYMADDSTYANEIKRMRGGAILTIDFSEAELKSSIDRYFDIKKDKDRFKDARDDEIIESVDNQFRKAVAMEYDKDKEYGYSHYADLSGGLDSRMAMWVAHSIENRTIQLGTWSKQYYLDETVAREIAWYWKDEILVRQLEDLQYLYDIDREIRLTGGLLLYIGPTGAFRFLDSLNYHKFGLRHTGQIGDAVLGTFATKKRMGGLTYRSELYSEMFMDKISKFRDSNIDKFDDMELYMLDTRGFLCASNHMADRNYFETTSPFFDADFLQLCMDIPIEKRVNHYMYKKWIMAKYPDAARFTWEKTRCRVDANYFDRKWMHIKKKIEHKLLRSVNKNSMNPLDYYLSKDECAKQWMARWFKDGINMIFPLIDASVREDLEKMFHYGNYLEKSMAMTVVGSLKLYFC